MRFFNYACALLLTAMALAAPPLTLLSLAIWVHVGRWDHRQSDIRRLAQQRLRQQEQRQLKREIAAWRAVGRP